MGFLVNRRNRDLSNDDIETIAGTYHNWRNKDGNYEDIAGFCKAATVEDVKKLNYVLTPGRYVGLPDGEDDFDFAERFTKLKAELEKQIAEEADLNKRIQENLAKIIIPQ
jgi:type I restriction enzyme M protein